MAFIVPSSCRRPFRIDIAAGACLAFGMAFLQMTGAILRKSLDAPDWVLALAVALPMASQVLSPVWSGASFHRRKVPYVRTGAWVAGGLIVLAALSSPLVTAAVGDRAAMPGLLDVTPEAAAFFGFALAAYLSASGFNVLLTTAYRANYPVRWRARIVSRINRFKFLAALPAAVAVAWLLEHAGGADSRDYIWFLLFGGLVMVVGGTIYGRQTVAGEDCFPAGANRPEIARRVSPRRFLGFLGRNPHFVRYQLWQLVHGAANLICMPAFIMLLTDDDKFHLSYTQIFLLLTVVPFVMQTVSTTLWAPMIDRLSPSKARTFNAPFWIVGWLAVGWAATSDVVWPMYVARAAAGIAMGGSTLIWALGSLHYSHREDPAQLVATHSLLTGARGMVFPLLGAVLYPLVGNWLFFIGAGMMALASMGYWFQDRAERRDPDFEAEADDDAHGLTRSAASLAGATRGAGR